MKKLLFGLALIATLIAVGGTDIVAASSGDHALRIEMNGQFDPATSTVNGTWQATGAFADGGRYFEHVIFARPPAPGEQAIPLQVSKLLFNERGSILLRANTLSDVSAAGIVTFRGGWWRIVGGTGAYAELRAGGRPAATSESFGSLVTGQVHLVHTGETRHGDD